MEDNNFHFMLARLYQHTKSMRKYQRNVRDVGTNYDKTMAKKFEQQVDIDINCIDYFLNGNKTPPAPPPT